MAGINVGRWMVGGVVAGIFVWLFEGVASLFYMEEYMQSMEAHSLSMEMGPAMWVLSIVVSLIVGLAAVFFYAAMRPRFGAGPKTAVIVGFALWLSGYLMSLIGYQMMGLFSQGLLIKWGVIGLIEVVLASILGAWIYRED